MEFASLEYYDIEGMLMVSLYDIIQTHSADTNHILSANKHEHYQTRLWPNDCQVCACGLFSIPSHEI